jgi:alpha-pyrone synthase
VPAGVFVNQIATAVPPHDFQSFFMRLMPTFLNEREASLFHRLMARSQIEHRFGCLDTEHSAQPFYSGGGAPFPSTQVRMELYKVEAPRLALAAASQLIRGGLQNEITHVVVGSCTGFYAPGVDFDLINALGLRPTVQRRLIGFMGCYAGLSVLQTAYEIVKSNPESRVLTVNVELCSLHLQKPTSLQQIMGLAQFSDGCGAAIVSAEPRGLGLHGFNSTILNAFSSAITWDVTDEGFAMYLDARLPQILDEHFPTALFPRSEVKHLWAIHPGGRSILDVVKRKLELDETAMAPSRSILRQFGNMSSATILFVLKEILESRAVGPGYAMAFGPGLAIEAMRFSRV